MGTRLVTIATFDQAAQARLAQNALQEAGIQAAVSDESLIAMDWLLSNAVGGAKVQVREEDAGQAVAVLEQQFGVHGEGFGRTPVDVEALTAEAEASAPEIEEPNAPIESTDESVETSPGSRDNYAGRMVFSAVLASLFSPFGYFSPGIGFIGLPFAFYAVYLFLNAAFGAGDLSSRGRFNLFVGVLLLMPFAAIFSLLVLARLFLA